MTSKKKHSKPAVLYLSLLAVLLIIITLAFLNSNDTVTNTFTSGDVKIALTEPNYPGNDSPEVNDLVPYDTVKKDPKITNTGSNDAVVFLKVTVPMAKVTVADKNGIKGSSVVQELFWLKNSFTDHEEPAATFNDGWEKLEEFCISSDDSCTYVFGYKNILPVGSSTNTLFDYVQLKNIIDTSNIDTDIQNIKIEAFAIQSDYLKTDDSSDYLTIDQLDDIYRLI